MPIYEYQCLNCNRELEALQKVSDEPLQECPSCGEAALKKKVSAAAFRLKGGGWYETDFKTAGKKNLAAGSDGGGESSSATTSSAASGDKKPASQSAGESTSTA